MAFRWSGEDWGWGRFDSPGRAPEPPVRIWLLQTAMRDEWDVGSGGERERSLMVLTGEIKLNLQNKSSRRASSASLRRREPCAVQPAPRLAGHLLRLAAVSRATSA
nr:unnamed protein product [Digitaria exilis]